MRQAQEEQKTQAKACVHFGFWLTAILLIAESCCFVPAARAQNSMGITPGISAGTGGSGSGSLSSVGVSAPPDLSVGGSPLSGAGGTITLGHSGQTCSATPCTVTAGEVGVNTAAGNIEVDLPVSNATQNPIEVCKADSSANTVTIKPNGSDQIDLQTSFVLTARFQCARVVDRVAGDWRIIASKGILAQDLNANLHKVTNLGVPGTVGDAVSYGNPGAVNGGSQPVNVSGNGTGGSDRISSVNGVVEDAINLRAYGFVDDVRSGSTCTITNANPGTISACSALNLAAADSNKLVRVVWPASGGGSNIFTGCILNGATGTLGTVVGGVCTAAAYTGTTETNAFVQIGTDALPALNAFTNALGDTTTVTPMKGFLPKAKMMISDTWDQQRRLGEIAGYGQFSGDNVNKPTTQIIWAGPRGHPIIRVRGTQSLYLHDIDLVRNSNPLNKPSACIDSLQDNEVTAFNDLDRINCNSGPSGDPDNGQIGGDKTAGKELKLSTYCMEFDPDSTGQNDRSYVKLLNCGQTEAAIYFGQAQIDTDVIDTPSVINADITISSPAGGAWIAYGVNSLTNALFLDAGGGGRYELYDPEFQSTLLDSYSYPFGQRLLFWGQQGAQVTIHGQQALLVSGSHLPSTGIAIDVPGTDLLPVYPGNSTVVAQNTLIQPAPQYPDWNKNMRAGIYVPEIWYASSPYANHTIILPNTAPNNPGGFYYRVTTPNLAVKGPGITGLTEPTWNQTVGGTTTDSQASKGGITWTNIGKFQPNYVIVPSVNNAGGYAYLLTTAGTTGATAPAFNQSVGGTTTDNTAVWTNIGVLGTNPGLFVLKATTGGTTGATPPAAFSQVYNGTTTDGTVVWTTTYSGSDNANTASLDTNDGVIVGGASTGDPTTAYEAYAPVNPSGASSLPHFFFNCSGKCQGWNQAGTLRFVSNKDNSASTNRVRTFGFSRSGFGGGNAGETNQQTITSSTATFRSHLNQLPGAADVVGGPFTVSQLAAPATPTLTCIVPVFVANAVIPANYVIKPAVANNAGSYFFQNQGSACVSGATEPNWNQTPAGTQSDGTCTWTNINTAPLTYFAKVTMRDGNQTPNLVGETLPSAEASVACGPSTSQAGVQIQSQVQPQAGTSRMGEYMSTSTGTEKLVQIARTDNDQLGNNGLGFTALVPIPQIPAPAWAATTTRRANDVLLPVNNNAAGDYFVLNTPISCVGGSSEPNPWNQAVGGTQADGECSWTNVGLGLVPTANTTATMSKAGNPVPSVVGATVAADCAKFDANGNLVDAACPAGSTSNSEWSGGTLSTNLSASATNYFEAMGMAAPSATESSFELPIALQTTFSKLSCTLSGTPGGSATYTFTLDTEATQGGTVTASAMTCQVASANQTCGPDNSHNIVVPAGSLVSIAAAPAGTPTARTARCVMQANM